ncbi:MAG: penicillin-binding protein activator LpoB [Planctomycetota bacterium]
MKLQRRNALGLVFASAGLAMTGCAGRQYGHLLASDDKDMVGSHAAGAATWNPLVESSVAKLLSRCPPVGTVASFQHGDAAMHGDPTMTVGMTADPAFSDAAYAGTGMPGSGTTVCFVGIENKSAEELGDFKDQLYETIDSKINSQSGYRGVSRRMVDAALRETRLRPDSLFLPNNRQLFSSVLGRQGTPVDYLLFANITSGTTDRNKSSQRDYVLTLEMVNVHSGDFLKESAKIRKGYSSTRAGKWWNYGLFDQADG